MAALTQERKTIKYGQDAIPSFASNVGLPLAAGAKLYSGALIAQNAAGNIVAASALAGLVVLGVCEATVDNTGGIAGALTTTARTGCFQLNNGTGVDAIAQTNLGQPCYVIDDNTVGLTNGGGTRPVAGTVFGVDTTGAGGVWVLVGVLSSSAGAASSSLVHFARNTVSAIAAYTKTAGTIQANANGAWATQDGVVNAVNDIVLFPKGVANIAASDVGPWQITSLGAAGARFTLQRPTDWASGSLGLSASEVNVSEGTLFANTKWYVATAGNFTVDTTAIDMYPRYVTQTVTLVAGAATLANVPMVAAAKTGFAIVRTTANTSTATTGGYHPVGAITPGALGTASVAINATIAAGTINAADISTLAVTIIN